MKFGLSQHGSELSAIYGPLLELDKYLDEKFLSWAKDFKAVEYKFPQLLAIKYLDRLQYFKSFPHLATFAVTLDRDKTNLKQFSDNHRVLEDGSMKLPNVESSTHVVTPAACYHAYVEFEGQEFNTPKIITTRGTCCRCEDHYEILERQWTFSMREIICIGTQDEVRDFLKSAKRKVDSFINEIGLDLKWEGATDPFFNPKNNPKYIFQKLEPVKNELIFDNRLAIASTNDHINYFGEAFNLTRNGETLSSGCIAFGMERWLSAIVNTFGQNPKDWPSINIVNE